MKVRVGQGVIPTGAAGTVDVTWSGAGTPTACMVFTVSATTLDSDSGDSEMSIGFSDFTNEIAFAAGGDHAKDNSDSTHGISDDVVNIQRADTGTIFATCQASTITDGIQLIRDQAGVAYLFYVVAFFGGEWAVIRELNNSTAINNTVNKAHTLSGEPNIGFFSMNEHSVYGNGQAVMKRSFGMFTNISETIVQRAIGFNGTGTPYLVGSHYSDARVALVTDSNGSIDTSVEITAIDGTNIEFTVRDSGMNNDTWGGLVGLIDEEVKLTTVNSPNDDTSAWNVNDTTFKPQSVIGVILEMQNLNTNTTNNDGNVFSIFAVDDLGNEHTAGIYQEDGAGSGGSPTQTIERSRLSTNLIAMNDINNGIEYEMQNLTFTADGFDVTAGNNIENNATTHLWPMMFIGEETAVSITDVNTTESWTDGDTGLVITGTGFV